ncbi:MAG: DUF1320 family protein [Capnocytophaga sp.]|nr:DUF1320 family protein [Capnocytophaga sp.]
MYLTLEELNTHAYNEELQTLIRGDETIALAAVDVAVEFAKSKLAKHYDTEAVFSATGNDRNALVLKIVKDIAVWELIGLANPGLHYESKKFRYEQAVDWLTAVFKGMPADLPKRPDEPSRASSFSFHSNPKRNNYF